MHTQQSIKHGSRRNGCGNGDEDIDGNRYSDSGDDDDGGGGGGGGGANCRQLPSGALVNCPHPPLPLPPLVGCCIVVHRPISLSLVARCHATVITLVAFTANPGLLPSGGLVTSRCLPLPLLTMVGCCIVVCCPLLSLPVVVQSPIPLMPHCPQALLLPAAARLCHPVDGLLCKSATLIKAAECFFCFGIILASFCSCLP